MEDPADFVNITFWHQELFFSNEGRYVSRQLELTKRIPPQILDDDFASTI